MVQIQIRYEGGLRTRAVHGPSGNALLTDAGCATNGFDKFDQIHFWRTPEASCATQGTCVPYSRWATDVVAVMGGR